MVAPKDGFSALMDDKQTAHSGQLKPGSHTSILIIEPKVTPDRSRTPLNRDFWESLGRKGELVRRSRAFGEYLSKVDPERAEKLDQCGGWLLFRDYTELDVRKLAGGLFCQQRYLCPFCASRVSARRSTEVYEAVDQVLQDHRHLGAYMVTLTMRSMNDRREMVTKFWDSWSRLLKHRRKAKQGKSASMMGLVEGGFMSGEAKLGKGGEPHYHGHGIFLADRKMRYKPVWGRLVREWAKLVGQSHASVQFEPVVGLAGGVREATKYAVKFSDNDFQDRIEWDRAIKGNKNTFSKFGLMRGLKVSNEVTDNLEGLEFENFVDRLFSFNGMNFQEVAPPEREPAFDEWNEGV